eukprot:CAMPEP_0117528728 /NCGR_PEP_ID=MMETSP0784-20121206/37463_1 /TAXON_ID=39447 /ORGANISM="" /LENGTH=180 /DNA_ID=CAMNT_0005325021 /DNA_START=68 /DNA_END=611 /DNA_ORIENTATION=-
MAHANGRHWLAVALQIGFDEFWVAYGSWLRVHIGGRITGRKVVASRMLKLGTQRRQALGDPGVDCFERIGIFTLQALKALHQSGSSRRGAVATATSAPLSLSAKSSGLGGRYTRRRRSSRSGSEPGEPEHAPGLWLGTARVAHVEARAWRRFGEASVLFGGDGGKWALLLPALRLTIGLP